MHNPITLEHANAEKLVIFVHGFMGGPNQFIQLSEDVYNAGYSFASLLLPGHGCSGKDFVKHGLHDWESHLQDEIEKFTNRYIKIYIVGHSMGGLLALNAAIKKENKIAGVFLISAPLRINIFNISSFISRFKLLIYSKKHEIKSVYIKSNSISKINIFVFPLLLKPIVEFYKLIRKTRRNLKKVIVPVYMVHSKKDETTSYKSRKILCNGLSNAPKETLTITKSLHAYFIDDERKIISEKLLKFLNN